MSKAGTSSGGDPCNAATVVILMLLQRSPYADTPSKVLSHVLWARILALEPMMVARA